MTWQFTDNAKRVRRQVYEEFLHTGHCSNPFQIAKATGLPWTRVITALDELERGVMVMLERDAHSVINKAPPWANFPTPHAVSVDGVQKWYSGCAIEAINIPYCHPGKLVTIDSSCPHCGDPVTLTLRDGAILACAPSATVIHMGISPLKWRHNWIAACANNSFFPSETHVKEWERLNPQFRGAAVPIKTMREKFNYTNRLDFERGADSGGEHLLPMLVELGVAPKEWR